MNAKQLEILHKRMVNIRLGMNELNRYGRPTHHYLKNLAIMVNNLQAARMEIEQIEMQLTLEADFAPEA